ncbi:13787_t:CDS:10, partial [Funneliformis mosseae]
MIKIPIEHLPATICNFLVKPGEKVIKSQSILSYEYKRPVQEKRLDSTTGETECVHALTQIEELKSPTEGELKQFHVIPGETVKREENRAVVGIIEPCLHSIQIHGLCALCGADITIKDSNGVDYTQRATISMAHNVVGLTVSQTEAERLEKETSSRLLEARKLSLIVDLDQTLVHATVEQTVEEWIKDEESSNHPTTKDIHKFTLPDGPSVYYIKLRPELKEFLRRVSEMYEPHIYTMGTRNYASAVANVIDPDNTIFNERILSRDESGSMTEKNIRRLFPCDDSMVVVIDDRADVWTWSPNLIKVHPYDFFVGIGDINDTYLPKTKSASIPKIIVSDNNSNPPVEKDIEQVMDTSISENNVSATEDEKSLKEKEQNDDQGSSSEITEENVIKNDKEEISKDVDNSEEKSTREPLKVNITENNTSIDALIKPAQNNKRSFKEISEDVINDDEKSVKKQQLDRNENNENENKDPNQTVSYVEQELITSKSKPILVDNDTELPNLLKALTRIHKLYYEEYDRAAANSNGAITMPDVTVLIPQMKSQVLKGVHILFTHVIPTNQKKEEAEIWILAREFGAECYANWNSRITHLVAGDRGTEKVKEARRKGNIYIVRKEWLDDTIKKWERQSEKAYALESSSSRDSESSQVSEIDKLPELIIETPSGNELTDDDDLLLSPEKRHEHFEATDWRSALNEVEELLAESGDTSALDESETETESNGRRRLKRYGDALDVDDRYIKRLKHSPLRQSITFNHNEDNEDESEHGSQSSFQIFNSEGDTTGDFDKLSEIESENVYQDSEL